MRFFQNFLKIKLIFREDLGNNLETLRNVHLFEVGGTEISEASEVLKNLVEKSMEICNF